MTILGTRKRPDIFMGMTYYVLFNNDLAFTFNDLKLEK